MVEHWTDEMLDRLADSVEQTNHNIEILIGAITGLISRADEDRTIIRQMQSDIRGLQTENRRILERLERHLSDGHGA
jgi:uncharacterized protein YoxC